MIYLAIILPLIGAIAWMAVRQMVRAPEEAVEPAKPIDCLNVVVAIVVLAAVIGGLL